MESMKKAELNTLRLQITAKNDISPWTFAPQYKCPVHGSHFETIVLTSNENYGTLSGPQQQVFCMRCVALLFASAKIGVMEKV